MKKIPFIGRLEEKKILENALESPKAAMISLIGRRLVDAELKMDELFEKS